MDIRKLQRAIVDGLEDVKGQDIAVFNTEHLSPLFERVIIASGTSNRQTKALAASVRDAVKSGGFGVPRTEGEDNGEWIIVDCGAAVVHVMQPNIREYYHLEEIWGDKPVKMKIDTAPKRLVKAEAAEEPLSPAKQAATKRPPAAKKAPARKATAAPAPAPAKKAPARKAAGKTVAVKSAGTKTAARAAKSGSSSAGKASAPASDARVRTVVVNAAPRQTADRNASAPSKAPARKAAAPGKSPARKAAAPGKPPARRAVGGTVTRTTGVKRAPAAKKAGRGG